MASKAGTKSDAVSPETTKRRHKACPLCACVPGTALKRLDDGNTEVSCSEVCGQYRIESTLCEDFQLSRLQAADRELKRHLSCHTRECSDNGGEARITEQEWRRIARDYLATPRQKADKLLALLRHRTRTLGDSVLLDTERDGRRCFCTKGTETLMRLEALEKQGRVRLGEYDGRRISCYLTTEGETESKADRPATRRRFPTPAGACWADVLIRIVSDTAAVIEVKGTNEPRNYIEMGFEDRKSRKPDRLWRLLKGLAAHRGATAKRSDVPVPDWPAAKKRAQELNKALKEMFGIEGRESHLAGRRPGLSSIRNNLPAGVSHS